MEYREKINYILSKHRLSIKDLSEFLAVDTGLLYAVLLGEKKLPSAKEAILIQTYHLPADYFRGHDYSENIGKTSSANTDDLFYQLFPEALGSDITYEKIRKIIRLLCD